MAASADSSLQQVRCMGTCMLGSIDEAKDANASCHLTIKTRAL
jgi:hypothetical protein